MARTVVSRRELLAGLSGAAALAAVIHHGGAAAASTPDPAADPAVIADWNATAVATIVTDAGKASIEAFIWYGFTQAAVYNAVVGITRRYELYQWDRRGPSRASPQAAAAAAAHRLLRHYFPASQARLDGAYAASLAPIPDGPAKQQGISYGQQAADRIIALRVDDGRNDETVVFALPVPAPPGRWRPTPPGNAGFFGAWLSQLKPLMRESPSQFRPAAPVALTSAKYAEEFDEVKRLGAKTGSERTQAQTDTALFVASVSIVPYQEALRELVTRRRLDISDSARLFAAVDMSIADTAIAVWDSKFHFGLWRPITAIRLADDDGNPSTVADTAWESLVVNPPYPDYVSGATGVAGALTGALTRVLDSTLGRIDLNITSPVNGLPMKRYYEFAADLNRDVIDARVWGGVHFRAADEVGNAMGKQVADQALDRYFRPGTSS
jgi:hypothetical protein